MRLTTMTQITLDGVYQGNGGASEEDRAGGFTRGGWARTQGDETTDAIIDEFYGRADAFLFGRRTYDLFAASWGAMGADDAPGWEATWTALHTRPKYVASTTLTDPAWEGSSVLTGDLASAIQDLKAQPGGELQVHGSGTLVRWLLANDLIDELTLITVPVVLGQGDRLFAGAGPDRQLELLESHVDSRGASTQRFRVTGRPEYWTA